MFRKRRRTTPVTGAAQEGSSRKAGRMQGNGRRRWLEEARRNGRSERRLWARQARCAGTTVRPCIQRGLLRGCRKGIARRGGSEKWLDFGAVQRDRESGSPGPNVGKRGIRASFRVRDRGCDSGVFWCGSDARIPRFEKPKRGEFAREKSARGVKSGFSGARDAEEEHPEGPVAHCRTEDVRRRPEPTVVWGWLVGGCQVFWYGGSLFPFDGAHEGHGETVPRQLPLRG